MAKSKQVIELPKVKQIKQHADYKKNIEIAKSLWDKAQPIQDNHAAKSYLSLTRGLPETTISQCEMRALPPEGSKPNRLITPVIDARRKIIGVQTVDLNPDGTKAKPKNDGKTVIEDRRYIDSFGKAALVKKGSDPTRLFIAEGVETAASIAGILKGDYTVMASLGITEMVHAIPVIRAQVAPGAQIVLLADNDSDKKAVDNLNDAVACFRKAGLDVVVVKPKTLDHDWNDVLQAKGNQRLKEEFCSLASESLLDQFDYEEEEREILITAQKTVATLVQLLTPIEIQTHKSQFLQIAFTTIKEFQIQLEKLKATADKLQFNKGISKLIKELELVHEALTKLKVTDEILPPLPITITEIYNPSIKTHQQNKRHFEAAYHELKNRIRTNKPITELENHGDNNVYEVVYNKLVKGLKGYASNHSALSTIPATPNAGEREKIAAAPENHLDYAEQMGLLVQLESMYKREVELENKAIKALTEEDNKSYEKQAKAQLDTIKSVLESLESKIISHSEQWEQIRNPAIKKAKECYLGDMEKGNWVTQWVTQSWINELSSFHSASEFTYELNTLPPTKKVCFIEGEEQSVDTTLENLRNQIIERSGLLNMIDAEDNSPEQQLLKKSIEYYAHALAISMQRSFLVKIPGTNNYQEFDGINDQGKIIERKENNGTGEDYLQSNFTQRKINEKMKFFRAVKTHHLHLMSELPENPEQYKNSYIFLKESGVKELYYIKPDGKYEKVKINDFNLIEEKIKAINNKDTNKLILLSKEEIKEIITLNGGHSPVEDYHKKFTVRDVALKLMGGKPAYPFARKWFSPKFDADLRHQMNIAAKSLLVDAINNPKIHFVFNRSHGTIEDSLRRNFYNANLIQEISLNESTQDAGNEYALVRKQFEAHTFFHNQCKKQLTEHGVTIPEFPIKTLR
ncbi:toprim domain-containing protein [Legionella pneumophila]|uniref:TraI n=1 Tax=Legionella pneumophila subsp. pascullei TaxID=91890 RepID=A0AAX2J003_LEGPN|nr:toprim domain-containing protein [Legionella pneumophila]AMP89421.1 hypothetical protein AXF35_06900 [Legionella pneumophila subsp. pascullei]AMP92913.1 hypothetical protein AXF36_09900 [Legionella pneumophila subsp. pascullei]AMP95879.1 hypothetical protein AXF37_09790 [Legionella pneumophila subsp. pascullei]SQG90798.1 TraI [Legionella pneumophila subsp. pascullei]VEH07343.1 TraI [Legionella pneumophila subsp. pascullei]